MQVNTSYMHWVSGKHQPVDTLVDFQRDRVSTTKKVGINSQKKKQLSCGHSLFGIQSYLSFCWVLVLGGTLQPLISSAPPKQSLPGSRIGFYAEKIRRKITPGTNTNVRSHTNSITMKQRQLQTQGFYFDGRNPKQPHNMYMKPCKYLGFYYINWLAAFLPSTVCCPFCFTLLFTKCIYWIFIFSTRIHGTNTRFTYMNGWFLWENLGKYTLHGSYKV